MNKSYFAVNAQSTKANVLSFLKDRINNSTIEQMYVFSISEWKHNETNIIKEIAKKFSSGKVIVRSSAYGEDSISESMAGNYLSVQNVQPKSHRQLKNAINLVIRSYNQKNNYNISNQILIQNQTIGVISSGVVFTRSADNGAPYFVINYEDGNNTDKVTKGESGNILKISRNVKLSKIPRKWRSLIKSIKELERILHTSFLDIEFGLKHNSLPVIFQVRPITTTPDTNLQSQDNVVFSIIDKNKKRFSNFTNSTHLTKHYILSDMADWNPSEIIGNNPNPLDYSLYDYLVMNRAWYEGRKILGYQSLKDTNLMVRFGNKPYVDVTKSFLSLMPQLLKDKTKKKLLKYYLDKLKQNPYLHDKVEFEILFTCYDLDMERRLTELNKYNFSIKEIDEIRKNLLDFTNDIINNFPILLRQFQQSINQLNKNRKNTLKYRTKTQSVKHILHYVDDLLTDCIILGVIPFSAMARMAFISSTMLKSAHSRGLVTQSQIEEILSTTESPLTEISNDLDLYLTNKISKKIFLKKYGHLRPGTYDITAPRYDSNEQFFDNMKYLKKPKKENIKINDQNIENILANHGLKFQQISFMEFLKLTISLREQLKFEFTKNLSEAIELIAQVGESLGFTRSEVANLEIMDMLSLKNLNIKQLKHKFGKIIVSNSNKKRINSLLLHPPIISNVDDFEIITHYISKPNYITNKSVTSETLSLSHLEQIPEIQNKIVLVEHADPGFDWIFTKQPSGLVTKYGGVASHMAIRCAEIKLPAAIGCGEALYEKLVTSQRIMLDCKNEQIIILEHKKLDEYEDQKRVLKSLGYIK